MRSRVVMRGLVVLALVLCSDMSHARTPGLKGGSQATPSSKPPVKPPVPSKPPAPPTAASHIEAWGVIEVGGMESSPKCTRVSPGSDNWSVSTTACGVKVGFEIKGATVVYSLAKHQMGDTGGMPLGVPPVGWLELSEKDKTVYFSGIGLYYRIHFHIMAPK